jgi:deoxyhypusine synthase
LSLSQHRSQQEADGQYDGSDSGARPDEAVSWGKIRAGAESVKVSPYHLEYQTQG